MSSPDWQGLIVTVNDRSAIYTEHFPSLITAAGEDVEGWFTHEQAQDVLFTFAGAWPTLGRDHATPIARYIFLSSESFVCRVRGVELAPDSIVVDEITLL